MYRVLLLALGLASLTGSLRASDQGWIVGHWRSTQTTGSRCDFEFRADGTVKSTFAGSEPSRYSLSGGKLIITGFAIAGQPRKFSDVIEFHVDRPDKNTLMLRDGRETARTPGQPKFTRTFKDASLVRCDPSRPDTRSETRPVLAVRGSNADEDGTLGTLSHSDPLNFVGPEGMNVRDILNALHKGVGPDVLRTMILGKGGAYKIFSIPEALKLKQAGIADAVVAAMMQVTIDAEKAGQRERDPARDVAEIARLQGRIRQLEEQQSQPQGSTATGRADGSAGQTGLADTAINCAKQAAALRACEKSSRFARSACEQVAKSEFPCPIGK